MNTVSEIEAAVAELEAKKQALINEKRENMIADVSAAIGGLSADDLKSVFEGAAARNGISLDIHVVKQKNPRLPAKYRNPADPEQTWSGRGKKPAWFDPARESEFLIVN